MRCPFHTKITLQNYAPKGEQRRFVKYTVLNRCWWCYI